MRQECDPREIERPERQEIVVPIDRGVTLIGGKAALVIDRKNGANSIRTIFFIPGHVRLVKKEALDRGGYRPFSPKDYQGLRPVGMTLDSEKDARVYIDDIELVLKGFKDTNTIFELNSINPTKIKTFTSEDEFAQFMRGMNS